MPPVSTKGRGDEKCTQNLPRSLQKRVEGCIERSSRVQGKSNKSVDGSSSSCYRFLGGSKVSKSKFRARFESFSRVGWIHLIVVSEQCDERAAISRSRSSTFESRVARAEMLVSLGELSSVRQALEGAVLVPRNQATLDVLRDADRRPLHAREPLPDRVTSHVPPRVFDLDEQQFCRNFRSARRGAVAGPSGMTTEHLRPLLNDAHTTNLFVRVGEKFPEAICHSLSFR